jgi:hypothetical protein
VVSDGDDARLFTVSPLREVYRGRARSLPSGDGLVEAGPGGEGSDAAVVVVPPRGGTAARLSPLPSGAGARIAAVDLTDDGRFAVVTAVVTDEEGHESGVAKAYDVARGRPTVAALPAGTGFGNPPTATLVGARQVGFRGGDLVVLDLASGGTLRRVPFPCGSKSEDFHARGNPTVDPTGRSLLVTCDRDGVLFDYPSLRRVRTFPDLVPGCDNGFFLDGHFARDGRSFVLHGCGGESRLEVRSGRFLCGDDDGLMGAPYGMGISVERVKPARAVGVPPCHPREELERGLASLAEHYRLESAETGATVVSTASPSTRIAVPSSGALPVVSSDESRLATSDGVHVTEYALPSGTPVRTVDP